MISSFFPALVALSFFVIFKKLRFQRGNNDTKSSIVSLPSAPTSPTSLARNWKYHVFPSFHGADVRKTFLSHIFASFNRKGIHSFIDNKIDRSKSIGPELIKAIRDSKIAIVLLSKKYASSSWCLDELAEIIKCREELDQIVMPVFYEVDPTDVKKQTGDFGKTFGTTCKGKTKECINKWRKALEIVATIAGEHSSKWTNEADMIEKIVTDVSNKLTMSIPSSDFNDFVGMGAHIKNMERLLCPDLDEVRMIGIWGPPGIGKSTIARVIFNQFSSGFQHGALMVNIKERYLRPCLDEYTVQLQLQNQMLSQIIDHEDIKISHLGAAKDWLKDKKVLLVIDEVDRLGQLDALAKEISWFGFGSRIIVTTEDRSLLKAHGINHIYQVEFPSRDNALEIFCLHAFEQKHPDDGFKEIAKEVSYLAGELPLGLKVLGSALRGKSKKDWEMLLPRLRTSLNGGMESIIKFSYHALCDEDKYLFLYIACIFNYESTLHVEELLAKQLPNVRQGLYILAEKSLISIDKDGTIEMHTLLEQFGRETSRMQYVRNGLAKRQILIDERDISEVFNDDTIDSNRFIAINLYKEEESEEDWTDGEEIEEEWINEEETAEIEEEGTDEEETEEELEISISDKSLKRISDLQFVRLDGSLINLQSLIFHSPKIKSLIWRRFWNICLPSTFNTQFLVKLKLQYSKLEMLWEGNKVLKNLKWVDLSCSRYLKELPDLSTATKLEELSLGYCSRLVELPDLSAATKLGSLSIHHCSSLLKLPSSIGNFNNFEDFDLTKCRSLVELPLFIGTATNLQRLDLGDCSSLVKLPSSVGDLINLEEILLYGCSSLVEIPLSIGKLQKLRRLNMKGCSKLEAFPTNINLKSLERLDLEGCSQLKSFPEISTNIKELNLKGSAINEIPSTIMLWPRLRQLNLVDCNNLVSLPQFPDSLSLLDASNCKSLERLDCSFNNPSISLQFRNCFKLNQEARDIIINASCMYATLPGREVPACFNYCRVTDGDYCTIKLNEWSLPAYLRFKACVMIKVDGEGETRYDWVKNLGTEIMTKPNNHMILVRLSYGGIRESLTEHIHILDVGFEIGAEVDPSTELFFKFIIEYSKREIGECGIMPISEVHSCL